MKIKYICLLTLLLCSRHFLYAQTDTNEVYIAKDFTNYTSFLQFGVGNNVPIGAYGSSKHPFRSSFATSALSRGFCVSALYSQKVKQRYGFEVGATFIRNGNKWRDFEEAYQKKIGGTATIGIFLYEHLSLYGGANYNISNKEFLFTASIGLGALYTKNLGEYGVNISTSGTNYSGGSMYIPNSIMPMFYGSVSLKYYLSNEFFIVGNCDFIYSLYRIEVTERKGWDIPEATYLKRNLTITNLAFTIGLGTLF